MCVVSYRGHRIVIPSFFSLLFLFLILISLIPVRYRSLCVLGCMRCW